MPPVTIITIQTVNITAIHMRRVALTMPIITGVLKVLVLIAVRRKLNFIGQIETWYIHKLSNHNELYSMV